MTSKTANRMAAAVVGIALSVGAAPATSIFTTAAHASAGPTMSAFDHRLVDDINRARMAHGLRPLIVAAGTSDVAHSWSCHLAKARELAHNGALDSQLEAHGSQLWTTDAENVGYVAATAGADRLFRAYMNSPEHRANILAPSSRFIGTWTKTGGNHRYNTIDFVGSRTTSYSTSYGGMRTTC